MAKVVNLNRARKAKARQDQKTQAERNRSVHGRTKAEKRAAQVERDRLARTVDGARRETDPAPPSQGSVDDEG